MKKAVFALSGLDCASCAVDVEKGLSMLRGVRKAVVNYAAGRAFVDFDERKTSIGKIGRVIKKTGYDFVLVRVG